MKSSFGNTCFMGDALSELHVGLAETNLRYTKAIAAGKRVRSGVLGEHSEVACTFLHARRQEEMTLWLCL